MKGSTLHSDGTVRATPLLGKRWAAFTYNGCVDCRSFTMAPHWLHVGTEEWLCDSCMVRRRRQQAVTA